MNKEVTFTSLTESEPVLKELKKRIDTLPKEVLPFLIALLRNMTLLPFALTVTILELVQSNGHPAIGPEHLELVEYIRSKRSGATIQQQVRGLHSYHLLNTLGCFDNASAAMEFIKRLPSVLESVSDPSCDLNQPIDRHL